jgi:hypothetical protein
MKNLTPNPSPTKRVVSIREFERPFLKGEGLPDR